MTAGGSLTNANWPASRPALPLRARVLHPRSSPALPRANCAPPPTRMSAFSTPPGHYSRSVHDGRERNNTRLLGSQSRAAGQGTLISGPKQFEAVTYSHPRLLVSGPRLAPSSFKAPSGGGGGAPHHSRPLVAPDCLPSFVAPARFLRLANEELRAGVFDRVSYGEGYRVPRVC
jgi:hypothetical protein